MTTSLPGPGVARVRGAVLTGIHAQIIEVQATISTGGSVLRSSASPATAPARCGTGYGRRSSTAGLPGRLVVSR